MNIFEVAETLNKCATAEGCKDCEYCDEKLHVCAHLLIKDMAKECEQIVQEMEDDGK